MSLQIPLSALILFPQLLRHGGDDGEHEMDKQTDSFPALLHFLTV